MSDPARPVRPRHFSGLLGAGLLALAAMALSGCEVTEASGNNYNSGPVCPMNYDPVCAERRGEERTFPNACQARAEDWRVVSSGQCRGGSYGDYRPDRRDYRGRDGRRGDYRVPQERNPYYRNREDPGRDYRNPSRDRNGQPDFEPPRYDNPSTRDPRSRPRTPPDQNEPPTYQPPVQPVQPVSPPPPPPPPPGACARGEGQVCGQVGSKAQWFRNVCDLESAGGIPVSNGTCLGGNR